jgi:hypothetical protein
MSITIRHSGIVVENMKKSLIFWNKILKLKILKKSLEYGPSIDKLLGLKNVKIKTIKLSDKNKFIIELIEFIKPKPKKRKVFTNSHGPTHIAITVKNLRDLHKKLKENKIKFNTEPIESVDKKVLFTYCKSPEGAFVELVEELK